LEVFSVKSTEPNAESSGSSHFKLAIRPFPAALDRVAASVQTKPISQGPPADSREPPVQNKANWASRRPPGLPKLGVQVAVMQNKANLPKSVTFEEDRMG
jgi:hypothetical protein